jgi:hypothetical protein
LVGKIVGKLVGKLVGKMVGKIVGKNYISKLLKRTISPESEGSDLEAVDTAIKNPHTITIHKEGSGRQP